MIIVRDIITVMLVLCFSSACLLFGGSMLRLGWEEFRGR